MRVSIRWALILGFVGLIWVTQVVITSSTYFTSEKVLLGHARDIMQNISDLTMVQSKNHLALAQGATRLTKRLMMSEVLGRGHDQLNVLEHYFIDQLAVYPHFAGIYVGRPNGDFLYVSRSNERVQGGLRTKIIDHHTGLRSTRLIWRAADGRLIDEAEDPEDTYDPRQRPWYRKVLAENAIVWTDPYIFFTSQIPGITVAGPIHKGDQLSAVVGVDIGIDQLSMFIGNLRIGKHGHAFMINNNEDVVAFPDLDKLKFEDEGHARQVRLVKIDELDDNISKAAFHAMTWSKDYNGRLRLEQPAFTRFNYSGETYHAMFTPLKNTQWPWIIGVYVPEKDYIGSIKANRRLNVLITLLLSAIASVIGLRLAKGIIRPLSGLEKEALAIKQNDLNQQYDTRSAYKEIQETANSFARMKASLKSSEEKYRSIFENIQDLYYEVDHLKGVLVEVSPSVEKIAGYTREEIIGASYKTFYHDSPEREAAIAELFRTDKLDDYEVTMIDKRGVKRYCAINAVLKRDADGNPVKSIGSLRIIDDRKQAEMELRQYQEKLEDLVQERTRDYEQVNRQLRLEVESRKEKEEQLRASEEKYRSIIENMDNGYYEADLSGCLTFFNDPMVEILGHSRETLTGMHFSALVPQQLARTIELKLKAIRRTGIPAKLSRYTILTQDGKNRTVEASIALIRNNEGAPLGFRGVVVDITERLNAEEEKKKLEERFQQILRLEGIATLAGGVAHDFNNLLMGIQGNVSLLLMDIPSESDHYEKLKSIESCIAGGANLTRQLLGFARGGKYMVKPLDLNQVTHQTVDMFGRTRRELQIVEKLQPDLWTVKADHNQIEQVLLNLYINAWQAMPDGGSIYIETMNVTLDDNYIRSFGIPSGRYVRLSVTDVGIGMDEATQQKVFEPFFTTKEVGRGTGLGLASAYGIIKNHGGAIDLSSKPGKGSTFYIYLPASNKKPLAITDQYGEPARGSGTILLVDDERIVLKVSQSMIEQLGYTVIPAEGGLPALEIFEQSKDDIDLVLLDMIMPDLSGGALFDHIRSIKPDAKVLLCSGYSLTRQAEDLLARGCAGFIQKPFSIERLSKKLQAVLTGA